MGWISAVFVHKAIQAAKDDRGIDDKQRALFRSVGVDPDLPADPKQLVPDTAFFTLLENLVADNEYGRSIPVRIGRSMRCDDYGAFGLAFKSAPDLWGSYKRIEHFGRVVTSIANFRVVTRGKMVSMEVIQGEQMRLGLTMTNELAVAAALSLSREVAGELFTPASVHFTHTEPDVNVEQVAHFGCPIHYGSDRDALEVSIDVLKRPNRLGDAGISKFFDQHLDRELEGIHDPTSLEHRILEEIGDALSEGVPTLTQVAGSLGMSSRTLQRRLSDAGFAYQDLVAQARRTLAERLLLKTDYALAEIAFLTGFSDQSTFARAFKRWNGQTPACFRQNS